MTRRKFCGTLVGTTALALGTAGCTQQGGSTSGTITSVNGVASLSFAAFSALQSVGDGVVVDSPKGVLAVLRTGQSTAIAMSAVCTHAGCTCEVQSGGSPTLYCACHGSEFGASGQVLAGPARRALQTYTASVTATGIDVTLG